MGQFWHSALPAHALSQSSDLIFSLFGFKVDSMLIPNDHDHDSMFADPSYEHISWMTTLHGVGSIIESLIGTTLRV